MSPLAYKVFHILGLVMTFMSLAGIWGLAVAGHAPERRERRLLAVMHGLGLTILLVSGFGLLAKLGYLSSIPTWAWIKAGLWLFMGASVGLAKRKAKHGPALFAAWTLAGTLAAYLCVYKPFN